MKTISSNLSPQFNVVDATALESISFEADAEAVQVEAMAPAEMTIFS